MIAKMFVAYEVTKIFHGEDAADDAKKSFVETFSKKKFPNDAQIVKVNAEKINLLDMISMCMENTSKSQIRRLITQAAVSIDSEKCTDPFAIISISKDVMLNVQVGKKNFFRCIY